MNDKTRKCDLDGFIRRAAKAAALCALAALMACAAPAASQAAAITEGDGAVAGDGMVAIGDNANADGTSAVAIGTSAEASADNAVALGAHSVAAEANTVSVGGGIDPDTGDLIYRRITNVADGEAGNDAATFGQLNSLGQSVKNALGESSSFSDGAVEAKFTMADGITYESVEKALQGVYNHAGEVSGNAVKYDEGKETVTLTNADGGPVRLVNLADGVDEKDAVNKGQLDAVQVKVDGHEKEFRTLQTVLGEGYSSPSFNSLRVGGIYSDGVNIDMGGEKITGLADGNIAQGSTDAVTGNQLWEAYRRMGDMQEAINVVGAHAAALSGLHPIQYNPYEPTTLSAAVGTYRDEYAVAVGVFHYVRSNVLFNLGASICSDGDVMGRAGVSFAVGKGGRKKPELARDMVGMQQQMIAMQAKLDMLEEQNKESEAARAKLMEENRRDKEIIKKNADIMAQNEKLIKELMKKLEAK